MAVKVRIEQNQSFAPCSGLFRIAREDLHRRAMAAVAANGGPEPCDEYGRDDNVLISEDDVSYLLEGNARARRDWEAGWDVTILMDRWEAFAHYGYDASEVS